MTDYYKLLCDPDLKWSHDPDGPFRLCGIKTPVYIKVHLRHFKANSVQRLKTPVVERPTLVVESKRSQVRVAATEGLSAKQRFNQQMELLIKRWRMVMEDRGCPHLQPWLMLVDDSLKELFHI